MAISDWKPRPRHKRLPNGYMLFDEALHSHLLLEHSIDKRFASDDWVFPNVPVIERIEEALDQLDAGIPLRTVEEWYKNNKVDGSPDISHAGLRLIWNTMRPQRPKPKAKPKKKLTLEDRIRQRRTQKIADEKKRIAAAQKRIEKVQAELGAFDTKVREIEQKVDEELAKPHIEVPVETIEWDFSLIEEMEEAPIFVPNPGPQSRFFAASEREVLYGGAAGGGKSYALIVDPARYFKNKNFNGLILRRTNDELRELIWKTQELYPKFVPGARWSEKKSSWTFPDGGHMWFTYLERDEDVMRYQGQAFSYIGFDELTQHPTPFAWNYLRSRLRTTDPELPLFMRATTNPGGPGHGWVKRMFVDPAPPGVAFPATDIETGEPMLYPKGHAREGQPLFMRKFIQASLYDNPYLTADGEYEANLMSLSENERRKLLEGDWNVADGAAFSEFRTNIHTCEPFDIPHDWLRFRSCDWGYSERQATAVHWYAVEPSTGTLYVYRELYVNQKTAEEVADKILELESGERVSYGVLDHNAWSSYGSNGPTVYELMAKRGCKWRKADKGPNSRIAHKHMLHKLMRVDQYSGKPGIVFFNNCRRIISDLPMIPMSKDDDDIDRKYPNDHAYDSIRYGISSRPKGRDSGNFWTPYVTQQYGGWQPSDPTFGY